MATETIYIELLDEGASTWRPAEAEVLGQSHGSPVGGILLLGWLTTWLILKALNRRLRVEKSR